MVRKQPRGARSLVEADFNGRHAARGKILGQRQRDKTVGIQPVLTREQRQMRLILRDVTRQGRGLLYIGRVGEDQVENPVHALKPVTAAKLGAAEVLAIDVDFGAVKVAGENIRRNGVEKTVKAVKGDMVRGEAIDSELVVANLVTGAISVLAEPVKRYLQEGGYLLCSGIIKEREQDALDSLAAAGYAIIERMEQGEWVALCARRMK